MKIEAKNCQKMLIQTLQNKLIDDNEVEENKNNGQDLL